MITLEVKMFWSSIIWPLISNYVNHCKYLLLFIFCNLWHSRVLTCGYSFLVMLQYTQLITVCIRALKTLFLWDRRVELSWCVQHMSRTESLSFTSVTDYKQHPSVMPTVALVVCQALFYSNYLYLFIVLRGTSPQCIIRHEVPSRKYSSGKWHLPKHIFNLHSPQWMKSFCRWFTDSK